MQVRFSGFYPFSTHGMAQNVLQALQAKQIPSRIATLDAFRSHAAYYPELEGRYQQLKGEAITHVVLTRHDADPATSVATEGQRLQELETVVLTATGLDKFDLNSIKFNQQG